MNKTYILILFLFLSGISSFAQKKNEKPAPAIASQGGRLVYAPDSLGNRVPDFSYAGYMAAEKPIPTPAATIMIPQTNEDATDIIQDAINDLGGRQADKNGFRGVILLQPGTYKIAGNLNIRHSGIVIRGAGMNTEGTTLLAAGKDRRTLIQITGGNDLTKKDPIAVTDNYVPVNSMTLHLPAGHGLKKGDQIMVHRPSSEEWIKKLGTDHFGGGITSLGWKPGNQDIYWDRTIVDVNNNEITLDAPITTALDQKYGGGNVIPYTWNGRINNVGIENLSCVSEYDESNPKDEAHSWVAIAMENISDGWVRNITFRHFAGSAVAILESAKRITVENCKSLAPISEIGGQRRYTFFTSGQQCLFQRLYAEEGYHDFALGLCAAGLNAFVQCESEQPYSFSGPVDSWASGVLFDVVNVNGNALSYKNRMQEGQGAGWNAANSVFWQCSASLIECFAPPTAQNWAFGSWSEFSGNGIWESSNNHVRPRSLYYAQLKDRLGDTYIDRSDLLPFDGEASSSPPIAVAARLTKEAYTAPVVLKDWIDQVAEKTSVKEENAPIYNYKVKAGEKKANTPLIVTNGWLTRDGKVQYGAKHNVTWWSGNVKPSYLEKTASPHITRFVPRRIGTGLTDDLDSVAQWMKKRNIVAIDHNYGLWYERRRDDHERIRRINGEVWPPFYEQPFARSGQGRAYDGLSKYDLTKYNNWYWSRLKQFAQIADKQGLVLMHQNYFQHNIIEAGAHWADSPWRPANNVNNTGFPEPAPYAGDKRIFLAEQFYDVNHPVRRELHKAYIKQCLNNFRGTNSVIHLISEEYTGPLHFVQFWLDVIAEWEAETGEKQLIALSTTKDVQDAILADPVRSKVVDIIDIRYWFYRNDGSTYAPEGGQNLAPRQHARLTKPGGISTQSAYRAVSEYKEKYPEKAVTFYSGSYPQQAWAIFMAKGSLASIPSVDNPRFLKDAASMNIISQNDVEKQYVLGNPSVGYIVYSENKDVKINFINSKSEYEVYWINSKTGNIKKDKQSVKGGNAADLSKQENVLWLVKK